MRPSGFLALFLEQKFKCPAGFSENVAAQCAASIFDFLPFGSEYQPTAESAFLFSPAPSVGRCRALFLRPAR